MNSATTTAGRSAHGFTFDAALRASHKVNWQVDDLIGPDHPLDFKRPFMPESFARTRTLGFLTPREQLTLNHIRAHGYLRTFGIVEEFILPFVLDHARPSLPSNDSRTRALLQFAGEEAKHIELFKRFAQEFRAGFGVECGVIGPPDAIATAILSHTPLAVALLVLQIEWMSQRHYLDSIADDNNLDPQFKSLLRHHWMEEAQHAKIDTLVVEELAAGATPEEIERGVEGYFDMVAFFDGGTADQARLDLESFERATGRTLDAEQRERFTTAQHQALRWTYLGSGMLHPRFLDSLGRISPQGRAKVEALAPQFS